MNARTFLLVLGCAASLVAGSYDAYTANCWHAFPSSRDLCCEFNPLVNPSLAVEFDRDCPQVDGDESLVGCVEFSGCRYVEFPYCDAYQGVYASADVCCEQNPLVNAALNPYFDDACPMMVGDDSLEGCVEFTQCRYPQNEPDVYYPDVSNTCHLAEFPHYCCENNAVDILNPELDVSYNPLCPRIDGDTSIVGCVEFTGCQYKDNYPACYDTACCKVNPLVNPSLAVEYDAQCPKKDGDASKDGCVEFTGCRYTSSYEPRTSGRV